MQHRQEGANNLTALKTCQSWTLPNLLANLTRRENCYVKHSASCEQAQMALAVRG